MTNEKQRTGARYRRSDAYLQELVKYIQAIADPQRDFMLTKRERVIVGAMRKRVSDLKIERMELYFVQGYTYKQISQMLNINISTVCRDIKDGENRMNQIMTFAKELLEGGEK